jgi:Mg2+-importing ATPase
MGTVVREGSGLGVVVATGGRTAFGAIALQLGERQPQTAFQLGLRAFSLLLVRVTAVLAGSILVINVVLGRSLLGSVLFALAIAVGLTPQLLPAIVTISLSTGAQRLAVGPGDLPNAVDGRAVAEGAVGAPLVVVAHPVWQRGPTGLA